MFPLQYVGMALATSIASWVNVVLLARTLKARGWLVIERRLITQCLKIVVGSLIMAAVLYFTAPFLAPYMARGMHSLSRFSSLIVLAFVGAFAYFLVSFALNTLHSRTVVMEKIKGRR